jgi:hypothetical protein
MSSKDMKNIDNACKLGKKKKKEMEEKINMKMLQLTIENKEMK